MEFCWQWEAWYNEFNHSRHLYNTVAVVDVFISSSPLNSLQHPAFPHFTPCSISLILFLSLSILLSLPSCSPCLSWRSLEDSWLAAVLASWTFLRSKARTQPWRAACWQQRPSSPRSQMRAWNPQLQVRHPQHSHAVVWLAGTSVMDYICIAPFGFCWIF